MTRRISKRRHRPHPARVIRPGGVYPPFRDRYAGSPPGVAYVKTGCRPVYGIVSYNVVTTTRSFLGNFH